MADFDKGNFKIDNLNELAEIAAKKLGKDAEQLKKEFNDKNVQGILNNLGPNEAKKLQEIISDKAAFEKLLSTPQAKQLLEKFLKK